MIAYVSISFSLYFSFGRERIGSSHNVEMSESDSTIHGLIKCTVVHQMHNIERAKTEVAIYGVTLGTVVHQIH